jgi:hypothetical protein
MRKRIVSSVVEELEKDVGSEGRHRGTERVADEHETFREQVQQEAAQELIER